MLSFQSDKFFEGVIGQVQKGKQKATRAVALVKYGEKTTKYTNPS